MARLFYPVGESGDKQHVVWNGTCVCLAAARLPAPAHLVDPAAFGMLDLSCVSQHKTIVALDLTSLGCIRLSVLLQSTTSHTK